MHHVIDVKSFQRAVPTAKLRTSQRPRRLLPLEQFLVLPLRAMILTHVHNLLLLLPVVHSAIIGIDYGHLFLKAVLLGPNHPFEIILSPDSKRKDLAAVAIRAAKDSSHIDRVYGLRSTPFCTRLPHSCPAHIASILGLLPSCHEAATYSADHFGLAISPDSHRPNAIVLDLGLGNSTYLFSPEELVAMHLLQIKSKAVSDLSAQSRSSDAVLAEDVAIAVPPFLSPEQRNAYLDALSLVPFSNILGLVDYGTAVALNYLLGRQSNLSPDKEYHVVFDMGAGSTSATLFSTLYNGLSVLELEGMAYDLELGGHYFTKLMHSLILEKFARRFSISAKDVPDTVKSRLWQTAEVAKITLTVNADYSTLLELLYQDKDFAVKVLRDEFEEYNLDILERITLPITKVIADAGLLLGKIKLVVVSGGLTRVPFVKKHLLLVVGEQRVLRSVNADELCALGTTLRALQWKTKLAKHGNVLVIDKIYHNFEVSVNGNEPFIVFPKLSQISNASTIDLGAVDKQVDVALYQDGRLIKSYLLHDVHKKAVNCTRGNPHLLATFLVNHNKMFQFDKARVECVGPAPEKIGFFDKLLGKRDAADDSEAQKPLVLANATNSSAAALPPKKKAPAAAPIALPKPTYPGVVPFSRLTRARLAQKLAALNARDAEIAEFIHAKNTLEEKCYIVDEFIESHSTVLQKHLTSPEVEKHQEHVQELLAWLDFGSKDANVTTVNDRYHQLCRREQELKMVVEMDGHDVSQQGLRTVASGAHKVAQNLREKFAAHQLDLDAVKLKYDNALLDFTHFRDKVVARLVRLSVNLTAFNESLLQFYALVDECLALCDKDEPEFAALEPTQIFSQQRALTSVMTLLVTLLPEIEKAHARRVQLLGEKLEAQILKRKIKLEQEKVRAEEKLKKQLEKELAEKMEKVKELQKPNEAEQEPVAEFVESDGEQETNQKQDSENNKEQDGTKQSASSSTTQTSADAHDEL